MQATLLSNNMAAKQKAWKFHRKFLCSQDKVVTLSYVHNVSYIVFFVGLHSQSAMIRAAIAHYVQRYILFLAFSC